jgi:hypothetical protein
MARICNYIEKKGIITIYIQSLLLLLLKETKKE